MSERILRLDKAGTPVEWLDWQAAAVLYARGLVTWTLGDVIYNLRGGMCRLTGDRSRLSLHSIIACDGIASPRRRTRPPLTNRALFRRDQHLCLYCGKPYPEALLTRDHIRPTSRGGKDNWLNVVAASGAAISTKATACRKRSTWNCWRCPMYRIWRNIWR